MIFTKRNLFGARSIMKLLVIAFFLILLLLGGGFGFFALTDMPIQQAEISKELPNDRFFE